MQTKSVATVTTTANGRRPAHLQDPAWVRWTLIGLAMFFVGILIVIPVISVFVQAFADGWEAYWTNLTEERETLHSILLTLLVAPIAVLANLIFGVAAAWAVARFQFPGRSLLVALIDLPFSVSPIVAGLSLTLIFGAQGLLGQFLKQHQIQVVFAVPGVILATTFVTLPFIARELIPVMEAIGSDEEIAAISLGASAWQMLRRITIPNIKWGLLYGVILCNARAMGEFGAVYVVSGRIPNKTLTMPLQIEKLFQGANNVGSFAVATLLTLLALVTLFFKTVLERHTRAEIQSAQQVLSKETSL